MTLRSPGTLLGLGAAVAAISAVLSIMAVAQTKLSPVMVLDQGWSESQRHLFYHISQGSFLMPAAWMEALEAAPPGGRRFMAPENMEPMGYIFDGAPDPKNPYGWPIGFAVDTDAKNAGIPQAGITCAACHTGQVEHRGKVVRIDGGQANIDVIAFGTALAQAVIATGEDPARRRRFTEQSVSLGYPANDIETRFDAFYRRILEKTRNPPPELARNTPLGRGRLDAVGGTVNGLFAEALKVPANFRPWHAPVNFPYLWDIWQFDWMLYNGSARQPMGRDMGEVIGQPGVVQLIDPATGELLPEPRRWQTTIRPHNIREIQLLLHSLKPPPWPEEVLGKIDRPLAAQGRKLFAESCAGCHGIKIIAGSTNPTEWHVPVVPLATIGTDPNHAVQWAGNTYDATKIGGSKTTGIAEGIYAILTPVKRQAYIDAGIPESEWETYDGFGRKDVVDLSPCGYKARPLLGVWATGPFLHNGSVPTVYDLLSETRPSTFVFGSREYDPGKLGFAQTPGAGTLMFDNRLPGNSNAGHWFTDDVSRPGRIGRAFTGPEKLAILEYLKAATPADYSTEQIAQPGPLPCTDDRDWAKNFPPTSTR